MDKRKRLLSSASSQAIDPRQIAFDLARQVLKEESRCVTVGIPDCSNWSAMASALKEAFTGVSVIASTSRCLGPEMINRKRRLFRLEPLARHPCCCQI